jgi:hypothetical protein
MSNTARPGEDHIETPSVNSASREGGEVGPEQKYYGHGHDSTADVDCEASNIQVLDVRIANDRIAKVIDEVR